VSEIDPDSAGLNPAWRKAIVHMIVGDGWASGSTVDEIRAVQQKLKDDLAILESLAPGGGAYFNEVCLVLTSQYRIRAFAYPFSSGIFV
jgi:hypothetical protein